MRALVTGGSGFVGRWLAEHLNESGDDVVLSAADVTDGRAVADEIVGAGADAVYHLAALAHVGESWDSPAETFAVNALGTVHILDAARRCASVPTVLVVSSAEVYGRVTPDDVPLTEDAPLRPVTPYAASKVAAEFSALQAHLGYDVPTVRARAFNHVGPGQAPTFVVPALARRITDAARTGARSIPVGNLAARRDFTDVRDVVRAYRLLVERGEPGGVYNVCSGRPLAVADLVDRLVALAGCDVDLEPDAELMRPLDVPVLAGDASRLHEATGWEPKFDLDKTLGDVLAEAESEADNDERAPSKGARSPGG